MAGLVLLLILLASFANAESISHQDPAPKKPRYSELLNVEYAPKRHRPTTRRADRTRNRVIFPQKEYSRKYDPLNMSGDSGFVPILEPFGAKRDSFERRGTTVNSRVRKHKNSTKKFAIDTPKHETLIKKSLVLPKKLSQQPLNTVQKRQRDRGKSIELEVLHDKPVAFKESSLKGQPRPIVKQIQGEQQELHDKPVSFKESLVKERPRPILKQIESQRKEPYGKLFTFKESPLKGLPRPIVKQIQDEPEELPVAFKESPLKRQSRPIVKQIQDEPEELYDKPVAFKESPFKGRPRPIVKQIQDEQEELHDKPVAFKESLVKGGPWPIVKHIKDAKPSSLKEASRGGAKKDEDSGSRKELPPADSYFLGNGQFEILDGGIFSDYLENEETGRRRMGGAYEWSMKIPSQGYSPPLNFPFPRND